MFIPEQFLSKAKSSRIAPDDYAVIFQGRNLLVAKDAKDLTCLPEYNQVAFLLQNANCVLAGTLDDGKRIFGFELSSMPNELPAGFASMPARALIATSHSDLQFGIARAMELTYWMNRQNFCGRCGRPLTPSSSDSGMKCPECQAVFYPQIAPAVIVAITRNYGQEILLGHNVNFSDNIYSLLAGFVETGETAEQAIHREIREEAGISVKNIGYLTSQVWPYPNSLMLGFIAEYAGGELKPDGTEITDAQWFPLNNLPQLPPTGSVARRIIDAMVHGQKHII